MIKKSIAITGIIIFLFQCNLVFADYRREGGHDRHENFSGRVFGRTVHRLPPHSLVIRSKDRDFLYCQGLFYRHTPSGYVIIEPPIGAIVPVLPQGYTRVIIDQRPFFYYADSYYVATSAGYQVVASPDNFLSNASTVDKSEIAKEINSYDIYIPNHNGSYTLVTLKKISKGFQGPKGEIYPEHPTLEQLKAMYGKI